MRRRGIGDQSSNAAIHGRNRQSLYPGRAGQGVSPQAPQRPRPRHARWGRTAAVSAKPTAGAARPGHAAGVRLGTHASQPRTLVRLGAARRAFIRRLVLRTGAPPQIGRALAATSRRRSSSTGASRLRSRRSTFSGRQPRGRSWQRCAPGAHCGALTRQRAHAARWSPKASSAPAGAHPLAEGKRHAQAAQGRNSGR